MSAAGTRHEGHGPPLCGCGREIGNGAGAPEPECKPYELGVLDHVGDALGTDLKSDRADQSIAAFGEGEGGDPGETPTPLAACVTFHAD